MSSWSVLAVRAARLSGVCVWLMSVRACLKVLGDSRERCGCLWFPDGLYCGGRWYVFLRKGPSRPLSPPRSSATDPPPPPPPPPPHPGDPSNYTNCINCTDRVGQSVLWCYQLDTHCLSVSMVPWLISVRGINEGVRGLLSKFHSYSINIVIFLSGRL